MGSAAVLLARPTPPRIETGNDLDCYVANFWRATSLDPEAVADHADWPVNECDLHSKHRWLVLGEDALAFRERMRSDPDYFDARRAGIWCWGLCCWIGSGWCSAAELREDGTPREKIPRCDIDQGDLVKGYRPDLPEKRPLLAGAANDSGHRTHQGLGVHAKGPSEKLPRLTGGRHGDEYYGGLGVNADKVPDLHDKRPQLHTGNSEHGRGVHGKADGTATWNARPYLGCQEGQHGLGVNAKGPSKQVPRAAEGHGGLFGVGVHSSHRPQLADAYSRGRGVNGNDTAGTCDQRRAWLIDWFGRLRDRLRTVRVCCGDWLRVCDSPSVTTRLGITGVFFDPPYSAEAGRCNTLYSAESKTVAHDVRAYCLDRGSDPLMRIVLAGYSGEGHEELEAHGWEVVAWKASGGYGNRSEKGKANAGKERLWISPHCLRPGDDMPLFARRDTDTDKGVNNG